LDVERVSGAAPRNGVRAESFPQLCDVDLDGVERGLRRVAGPERLDEPVDRDDVPDVESEHREERARLRSSEGDVLPADDRLEWPEEPHLEGAVSACPARSVLHLPSAGLHVAASHGMS